MQGVYKLSKNLGTTSKFYMPEGLHKTSFMLRAHNSGVACEHHCYLVLSAHLMNVN